MVQNFLDHSLNRELANEMPNSKFAKHADGTVKMSKEEVNYGDRDPGGQCGGCRHYNDGKCKIVEGDINPELGCDLFESITTLIAKYTQHPGLPEPNIDIVTGEKKKTGFYSLIHTRIGSMISMLDKKPSQTGSSNLIASLNTLKINNMKLQVRQKID